MNKSAKLSIQDIIDKNFKKSLRGYSEEDVDLFLDEIIVDYEYFISEIERLNNEIARLKKSGSSSESRRSSTNTQPQVNYDVLKRLSNLEKAVFGQKTAENEG